MTPNLTSADLQQFIDAQHIEAEILVMAEHTPTVPDAARALQVEPEQIIKSLVFLVNDEPLLVINNGTALIDRRKVAARLDVGRKKVKFAGAEQALAITGYIVGSMPPFGHRQTLRTFIDPAITELEVIYGGGGDIDAMLRLTPAELLRVTEGEVLAVSE
ncbi:MAG: YbaK/EbsC family protein [Anaerolineae bacterium]|nr:YbaK/EbsC family protein [Anaerolineae bacterium]MCB0222518.1 YbaK/EbsC family protein [Anaerolineae bacterium]MCB9105275.1 YbaK/EbsC family protein [Anaerolineales bacterium]